MPASLGRKPIAPLRLHLSICLLSLSYGTFCAPPDAAVAFGVAPAGSLNASRWDAAPLDFDGLERSLDGGLRYSLQTGSYAGFRDLFTWKDAPPTTEAFTAAVQAAFNAWTITDPATGLGTALYFVPDLSTPVDRFIDLDVRWGSEIDLFAATSAFTWSTGDPLRRGEAGFSTALGINRVTLTSGVANYRGAPITGADIILNCNPQALWDLPTFQAVLTHEIGHTLGLADVDISAGPNGYFLDDNYDGSSSASALATLTNSFAALINPYDPRNSPIRMYFVADGDPGMDSPGVDILMESRISSVVINRAQALTNDDFAGRQFLYPYVIAEPSSAAGALVLAMFGLRRGRPGNLRGGPRRYGRPLHGEAQKDKGGGVQKKNGFVRAPPEAVTRRVGLDGGMGDGSVGEGRRAQISKLLAESCRSGGWEKGELGKETGKKRQRFSGVRRGIETVWGWQRAAQTRPVCARGARRAKSLTAEGVGTMRRSAPGWRKANRAGTAPT